MNLFYHEQIYRGKDTLAKIKNFEIVVCGAGAIGSNLVENLVRQGFGSLTVVDKDRIEDRNINTQVWTKKEIGALKANALKFKMFDIVGIEIISLPKELGPKARRRGLFRSRELIIDAFDNSKSRRLVKELCLEAHAPCLHISFSSGYGEIIWDEDYRVPDDRGEDDCDYPLARNLIMLLVAVASEVIIRFITKREKKNYTVTLNDFKIERYSR
ncbi:unnamed protein product [marine sediment metagenome]|uniref:THIF-type NAD/FAD binding fold domain-containing protein n=1 Tax=marine sediment metagenome TaxID=412755 RepID=X1R0V6_9ZZZZ